MVAFLATAPTSLHASSSPGPAALWIAPSTPPPPSILHITGRSTAMQQHQAGTPAALLQCSCAPAPFVFLYGIILTCMASQRKRHLLPFIGCIDNGIPGKLCEVPPPQHQFGVGR
jgi:hypothetical protein